MSVLATAQREFIEALYSQRPCEPGVEVYRRNMLANLGGALAATFPVVERLVGEAFFREAARAFVLAHPSRSGDLNEYGESFADFLEAYPHARSLTYLADVARLEWACHESYQAADAAPFDLASLASVPADGYGRIRFALHPAVRLVRSAHAIESIWSANQPTRDGTPDRDTGPDSVVVCREDGVVRVSAVAPDEWDFLRAISKDATLEEASAAMDETFAAKFLAGGLARLVRDGVIAGFSVAAA
ncbi:MAG TPA: DNA-binding domain-containing protein [Usitatibacter sp.]|nr:DNA-binding domain-containing protein [Usitatibacter sp.]